MSGTVARVFLGCFAIAALAGCGSSGPPPAVAPAPDPTGRFDLVGRGPVTATHTTSVALYRGPDGRDYALTGTSGQCTVCFGDRLYLWDLGDPARPALVDSVMLDARILGDVQVNREGTLAIVTREGAPSLRNGITLLDLTQPGQASVVFDFWETLTGGVRSVFMDGDLVYAVNTGTADLHVIDVSNRSDPRQLGRWGVPAHPGKYLSDVWVRDGLAYLSYWNDGLIVVDVGNGIRNGSPQRPEFVSQLRYRVEINRQEYGNTATALPYTNAAGRTYIFVGDQILPPGFDVRTPGSYPAGFVRVLDGSNVESLSEVARYEVPRAGVSRMWVENDVLYVAYLTGGVRALDVSGELRGDLRAQGRELAVLATADDQALVENRPFARGVHVRDGLVAASDHNSGLWVARLLRSTPAVAPED